MEFTRLERETIKRTWLKVSMLMDSSDLEGRFDDLVKQDKRDQTKNIHSSRVLMCRCWFNGFDNPAKPLSHVAFITPTACQATMYGVRWSGYDNQERIAEARAAMAAGEAAHRSAMDRFLAGIGKVTA